MRLLSAGEGQIVPFLGPPLPDWTDIIRHSPLEDSVGTQWETCGKNRQRGLGTKGLPQKKVLSLVLCVAMLLSVMVMGTGAAFTDQDEISDNYAEAAEVLTGMGIIQGYDDGSFLPQRNINRAQVATMIYRAATGDVTDSKISQFVGEDLFDDVNADDWFAGYVNYCGNAEYIKGFTPDTFGPNKNVTGYQVLAMILRAVGYDENNEYTGADWTIRVAATANELHLLDNLNEGTNLSAPATRELVAELIFQAMQKTKVTYGSTVNQYIPDLQSGEKTTLGLLNFDLRSTNDADPWGRPAVIWYADVNGDKTHNDKETVYATIEETALATYTEAVNDCDVYEDTGVSGDVDTYVNGLKTSENISKTATNDTIGAQGRLTEVYANRIVMIDTFLAVVTDVENAKYDANNHLATPATLTLTAYDSTAGSKVVLTNGATNYTYTAGQALLINAYTDANGDILTNDDQYVEIYGVAESFVGAQTKIHIDDNYHTINGTDYPDAYTFFRNDAGASEDYNFNWWLDQYGNVIGSTAITSNYAVLKDMTWINGGKEGGHAEATLVNMDGTESTVTVDSIDGIDLNNLGRWDEDDATPYMADTIESVFNGSRNFGGVSTDATLNGAYEGYALYRIDTNSDGSVNLEGFERYASDPWFYINYLDNVSLNANRTAILNNNNRVAIQVSDDTKFLVKSGDTYTAGSRSNLPAINWQTAEVFYSDADNNGIAENVYVKSYSSVFGDYVFATSTSREINAGTWGVTLNNVYVDGVLTEVTTSPAIADQLVANQGKLYAATWNLDHDSSSYGQLAAISLVNEGNDNDIQLLRDDEANYLEDIDHLQYTGGILYVNDGLAYNVGSTVEVIYNEKPYTMDLADVVKAINNGEAEYGIWVVGNRNGDAFTIYAGTRLNQDNTITLKAEEGLIDEGLDGNTYTYTINDKRDNGKLDIAVTADGYDASVSITKDGAIVSNISNVKAGDVYKVTVTTECDGVCSDKEWTIEITDGWNIISDVITDITRGDKSATIGNSPYDVYYSFDAAVKNATTLSTGDAQNLIFTVDKTVVCDSDTYKPVKHVFASTATKTEAQFEQMKQEFSNSTVSIVSVASTDTVVLGYTPQDEKGEYVYFAFQIQK